jgi:hypothetical protein
MPITNLPPVTNEPPIRYGGLYSPKHLSPSQIKQKVDQLLSTDRSNLRESILEMLYQFVVLSEKTIFDLLSDRFEISGRIDSFRRNLRTYRSDGLIANVSQDVLKRALRAGLPKSSKPMRAYFLGPVGSAYADAREWGVSADKPKERTMAHDLICSEAMIRMGTLWREVNATVDIYGPREVAIWDRETNKSLIEPDGLFVKRKPDGEVERAFLVEYQNVNSPQQVHQKLSRYKAFSDPAMKKHWQEVWPMDEMPWILIIYRQPATLTQYQSNLDDAGKLVRFASISLSDIWAGNLVIKPIQKPDTEKEK